MLFVEYSLTDPLKKLAETVEVYILIEIFTQLRN